MLKYVSGLPFPIGTIVSYWTSQKTVQTIPLQLETLSSDTSAQSSAQPSSAPQTSTPLRNVVVESLQSTEQTPLLLEVVQRP